MREKLDTIGAVIMAVLIVAALLFLAACGPQPCDGQGTYYAAGMCVDPNGFDVPPEAVEFVAGAAEYAFNKRYPENPVDIETMFSIHGYTLDYWVLISLTSNLRGLFIENHIHVRGGDCWTQYYVLGHEILHAIAKDHLDVTQEENAAHMTPELFFRWANQTGEPREDTAEFTIGHIMREYCGIPPVLESQ